MKIGFLKLNSIYINNNNLQKQKELKYLFKKILKYDILNDMKI